MYEKHFGLNKRPFRAKATGTDVFVGPQTAKIMAGLKKVLVAQDVVATVAGPVGTGKTTIVGKALAALQETHKVIRIGRMHLDGNDVLDLLLAELGIRNVPAGAIQKFTAFREHLKMLEAHNARLVVLVEDASRIGVETLAEIEALTAADGGESDGANVVLLGDQNLDELLNHPQLGRMRQRRRQRFNVTPLSAAELRGYLLHSFRLAGSDFEQVFDDRCAPLVHALSGGVPRVANNLVESALVAGAAAGVGKIPAAMVAKVAADEYGLTADMPDTPASVTTSAPEPRREAEIQPEAAPFQAGGELQPEAEALPDAAPLAEPTPVSSESDPVQLPEPDPEPVPELDAASQPVPTLSIEPELAPEPAPEDDDIPELIQDTLPDLEILSPELAAVVEDVPEPAIDLPEPDFEIPELTIEPEEPDVDAASSAEDVPDWERDPTFAELRPDFDALEAAMAQIREEANDGPMPEQAPGNQQPAAARAAPVPEVMPEITLDKAIQTGIKNNLIDEPGEVSRPSDSQPDQSTTATDVPDIRLPPRQSRKADAELEKIAAELAKAKTIEDVDDRMAETLFGEEINLIAAQVVANPPTSESANDDVTPVAKGTLVTAQTARQPEASAEAGPEIALETRAHGNSGLDPSASQRLKTVRALNADPQPLAAGVRPAGPANGTGTPTPPVPTPEPIEDQINTSMTQTLKALNVRPPVATQSRDDDDDDQDRKKGGFFGRFRR